MLACVVCEACFSLDGEGGSLRYTAWDPRRISAYPLGGGARAHSRARRQAGQRTGAAEHMCACRRRHKHACYVASVGGSPSTSVDCASIACGAPRAGRPRASRIPLMALSIGESVSTLTWTDASSPDTCAINIAHRTLPAIASRYAVSMRATRWSMRSPLVASSLSVVPLGGLARETNVIAASTPEFESVQTLPHPRNRRRL